MANSPRHCSVFLRVKSCSTGAWFADTTCRRLLLADWNAGVRFRRWPAGTRSAVLLNIADIFHQNRAVQNYRLQLSMHLGKRLLRLLTV